MSRKIKFRAWDKKQNKMLYGVSTGTVKVWDENAPLLSHEFSYSEDCEFEQSTGLTDKNGKEIYEGDLVEYGDSIAVIIWRNEHAEFGVKWLDCGIEDSISWQIVIEKTTGEVIGNVHEHPELVENSTNTLTTCLAFGKIEV